MKIELNIFTNSTKSAPDMSKIVETHASFRRKFGEFKMKIYFDQNPNVRKAWEYRKRLEKNFKGVEIYNCLSLSHGYVTSIKKSDADFIFQLEHDWIFNDNIIHDLHQIAEIMRRDGLYHFRFNKRANVIAGWDHYLDERDSGSLHYCLTNCLSNNPHMIDVTKYREEIMHRIVVKRGSKGIEEVLMNYNYHGAIYGPIYYNATIKHLDGRH